MCKLFSGLFFRDGRLFTACDVTDSHEDLIVLSGVTDRADRSAFVRVEYTPPEDGNVSDLSLWQLSVDEEDTPDWYSEERCRREWEAVVRPMFITDGSRPVLLRGCWILAGDAIVREARAVARLALVCDSASVGGVCDSARVGRVSDSASVDSVYGSARVVHVCDSASVGSVCDSASVDSVYGSARVERVCDSARVVYVCDSARVDSVYGSARVERVYGSARVGRVSDSASVGGVCDSARVDSVYGSARVGRVCDSASVDSVYGSARVGYDGRSEEEEET